MDSFRCDWSKQVLSSESACVCSHWRPRDHFLFVQLQSLEEFNIFRFFFSLHFFSFGPISTTACLLLLHHRRVFLLTQKPNERRNIFVYVREKHPSERPNAKRFGFSLCFCKLLQRFSWNSPPPQPIAARYIVIKSRHIQYEIRMNEVVHKQQRHMETGFFFRWSGGSCVS